MLNWFAFCGPQKHRTVSFVDLDDFQEESEACDEFAFPRVKLKCLQLAQSYINFVKTSSLLKLSYC